MTSPVTAHPTSDAKKTAKNAISEASTMRQIALPCGDPGAKSCRSCSSGVMPSSAARAANPIFDLAGIAAGVLRYPIRLFLAWILVGTFLKFLMVAYACAFSVDSVMGFFGVGV